MFFMKMGLNDSLVSFSIATLLFLLHLLLWEERYLRNYVRNNNDIEKVAKLQKHVLREDDLKILQRKEFPEVGNDNTVLLTLFSTWKRGLENKKVYNNTIHVWATLKPWVKVVFFGDEGDLDPNAQKLNWHFLPVSQTYCNGTPVLKSMFRDVYEHFDSTFYGYANGDILFDRGLIDTLLALKKSALHKQDKMMLLSGRRIDIYLGSGENVTDIKGDVAVLSLKGAISYGYAADYFITTRTFPWEKIPNFVVGRPQYDNFLLYMSRQHHVHVIDASMTIVALHQRTKERKKSKDECNERIMKEAHIYRKRYVQLGHLDCAKYETRFNNTGEVLIIKRGQFTRQC